MGSRSACSVTPSTPKMPRRRSSSSSSPTSDHSRGESAFTTWVWRVAANHLTRVRKGRRETVTFETLDDRLRTGLRDEASDRPDPEGEALARELRLRCTEAMILSLDRELRIAYVLGDIFNLAGRSPPRFWRSTRPRIESASLARASVCTSSSAAGAASSIARILVVAADKSKARSSEDCSLRKISTSRSIRRGPPTRR